MMSPRLEILLFNPAGYAIVITPQSKDACGYKAAGDDYKPDSYFERLHHPDHRTRGAKRGPIAGLVMSAG
jgi:hypothetical protein